MKFLVVAAVAACASALSVKTVRDHENIGEHCRDNPSSQ